MPIIDTNLESQPSWEKHVGSDISGQPNPLVPDDYGFKQWPECTKFYIKGGPYTQWLAAQHRPVLPNTGLLSLSFDLMTDNNTPKLAQAIEFDTRVSIDGWNYNFSCQLNYAKDGLLQVSGQDGKWLDTTYKPGKLLAGIWHQVKCKYVFDIHLRMYQTIEVRVGTGIERYQAPVDGMIEPTRPEPLWKDSCSLQIQQDLNQLGGEFSIYIRNVQYEWK